MSDYNCGDYQSGEDRKVSSLPHHNDPEKKQGGTKHDGDKPDLSLLPFKSLEQVSRVLMFGAGKYGRNNWKLGFKEERLIAAALRHLGAYVDGEPTDKESGISHIAHAACNLLFILWFLEKSKEENK